MKAHLYSFRSRDASTNLKNDKKLNEKSEKRRIHQQHFSKRLQFSGFSVCESSVFF